MALAFILMIVQPHSQDEVMRKLEKISEIQEFYTVFGEWDVVAKAKVPDMLALNSLVSEKIRKIKAVKLTSTLIVAD